MLFYRGEFNGFAGDLLQDFSSPLRHGDLAAAEHYRHFHLVFFFDKSFQVSKFDFKVMTVGLRPKLDFLDLEGRLFFSGFLLLFIELVLVPAIIHNLAYGGFRIGRNLNQVKSEFFGSGNGGSKWYNTQLIALRVNYPDLFCLYFPIDFNLLVSVSLLGYLTPPIMISGLIKNGRCNAYYNQKSISQNRENARKNSVFHCDFQKMIYK